MTTSVGKTVLIVAGEFPPVKTIGRLRAVKFAGHLQSHGWRPVVLTVMPNGTSTVADPALGDEIPEGVEVVRVPHPDLEAMAAGLVKRLIGRTDGGTAARSVGAAAVAVPAEPAPTLLDRLHGGFAGLLRHAVYVPDSYNLWAWRAAKVAEGLCARRPIDLVFTTLPPFSAARVGYQLKRRCGVPWVADYRDLWTGDVLREWIGPWRGRLERHLERRWIGAADAVVANSEQKAAYLRRLHAGSPARWETITNGYDEEEFAGLADAWRPSPDGTVSFVFTGRLFKNRRGYAFAEALGRLKRIRPDLADRARVVFLGGVSPEIRRGYKAILVRHGLERQFRFAGDLPHADAKMAQASADHLLLIVDTGETSDGVIPGKLFEYMAARRPIFALADSGATADIIMRGRLGRVVGAEDVEACTTALAEVLATPVPARLDTNEGYLARFDRRALAARLAALFDELVAGRDG